MTQEFTPEFAAGHPSGLPHVDAGPEGLSIGYEWHEYQKTATVLALQMSEEFFVKTPSGLQQMAKGDYLVWDRNTEDIWGVTRRHFEESHRRVR